MANERALRQQRMWAPLVLATSLWLTVPAWAQPENHPVNGVRDTRPGYVALQGATLHLENGSVISEGTLVLKEGKIVSAGPASPTPAGAVEIRVKGRHIYPAFVDLWSHHGMAEVKRVGGPEFWSRAPQYESARKGPYTWNQAIRSEQKAASLYAGAEAGELRKAGFGAVLTHQPDGIARGTGALVLLAERNPNEDILKAEAATFFSFDKGSSTQQYPSSLMGSIALLRQTFYDAAWYAQAGKDRQTDLSLEALSQTQGLPAFFEAKDYQNVLRVDKIAKEFQRSFIVLGGGDEYQRLAEVKATGARLLVPLNFPLAYKIDDPDEAERLSLADMKHWELAPFNPARLEKANIPFALTAAELKNKADFLKNLRKAVKYGLSETKALQALTLVPAQWARAEGLVGSLKSGAWANLLITDGNLFDEKTKVLETWSGGERFLNEKAPETDWRGTYTLAGNAAVEGLKLALNGKPEALQASLKKDSTKLSATFTAKGPEFTLSFLPAGAKGGSVITLQGWSQDAGLKGTGFDTQGRAFTWNARLSQAFQDTSKAPKADSVPTPGAVLYPFMAFGRTQMPKLQTYLFRGATVWTSDEAGRLENTDVRVENGKIAAIGKNLPEAGAIVVEAQGKHLTPGLIDEHSHISVSGSVNEGTQSVSAEVRIGDVVDAEDINMYRQLAGGVIGAQLLHGSANCIGGQSALIKHKWGSVGEELKIKGADGFIKFALGENVKQTNWGERYTSRFPQSRMGVEQIMVDAFTRAQEYDKAWATYTQAKKGVAPRRDLELEALREILAKKRFITCHSYIQSEINMLMKVGEQFNFRVNTFTHILEGYKVADKMKAHGAGGSTFADWWAYKMEVMDAIPFNPALMTRAGIVTAINSDDAEMGRRLNQEAAKTVKYGQLSEEEALKTVTHNPAKLLHLDHRTGSIKVGKDADLVLWNGHPLSVYSKPEKTLIEGAVYFDQEEDVRMRQEIAAERQRLIARLLAEKLKGAPTQPVKPNNRKMKHCEDLGDEIFDEWNGGHDHQTQSHTHESR